MKYVKTFFCYLFLAALLGRLLLMNEAVRAADKAVEKKPASSKSAKEKQKADDKAIKSASPGKATAGSNSAISPKKSKLSPEIQASVQQANSGFKDCQSAALSSMKAGTLTPKEFKVQVSACRERYPGAGLYVSCKKKLVAQFSQDPEGAKAAISQCKKFLVAASFDPAEALPFFVHEEKLYFAGIGLNKSQSVTDFSLPNFDCAKLVEKAEDPRHAEHILFGNHPVWFEKLRGKRESVILELLKAKLPIPADGQYIEKFGRIFGDPTKSDASVFFPSSSCAFSGELGTYFSGLTTYFLIDSESKALTPYFAIAFYKPQLATKGVTAAALTEKLLAGLGEGYVTTMADSQKTMLSLEKITKFDEDGEAKDLCKLPRKHKFLAIIKARSAYSQELEFILVANISQLCAFGDRVSNRL